MLFKAQGHTFLTNVSQKYVVLEKKIEIYIPLIPTVSLPQNKPFGSHFSLNWLATGKNQLKPVPPQPIALEYITIVWEVRCRLKTPPNQLRQNPHRLYYSLGHNSKYWTSFISPQLSSWGVTRSIKFKGRGRTGSGLFRGLTRRSLSRRGLTRTVMNLT